MQYSFAAAWQRERDRGFADARDGISRVSHTADEETEVDGDRATIDVQFIVFNVVRLLSGNEDRVHDPRHARSFRGERLGRFALQALTDLAVQIHHTSPGLHAD